MATNEHNVLPDAFDLSDFEAFHAPRISPSNLKSCMRVVRKLTSGQGVTHANKPGETFLSNHCVSPHDDLKAIQKRANEWLPHLESLGPNCLDKGHGWALNHPIQKLIDFKSHLLGIEPPLPKFCHKRPRAEAVDDAPVENEGLPFAPLLGGPLTNEQAALAHARGMPLVPAFPLVHA